MDELKLFIGSAANAVGRAKLLVQDLTFFSLELNNSVVYANFVGCYTGPSAMLATRSEISQIHRLPMTLPTSLAAEVQSTWSWWLQQPTDRRFR